jgi:hypothetical protein
MTSSAESFSDVNHREPAIDLRNVEQLRQALRTASINGRDICLSGEAAGLVALAMLKLGEDIEPPGTHKCFQCEGKGVVFSCVICASDEAGRGTCGSSDPRALCNFSPKLVSPSDGRGRSIETISSVRNSIAQVIRGPAAAEEIVEALKGVLGLPEWDIIAGAGVSQNPPGTARTMRFQDEIDAASAGWDWIGQFQKEGTKLELLESSHSGKIPRIKWAALFDCYDRLTHAYLLSRDEKNWTQVTFVEIGDPSGRNHQK